MELKADWCVSEILPSLALTVYLCDDRQMRRVMEVQASHDGGGRVNV
jgi:hypothetical protein